MNVTTREKILVPMLRQWFGDNDINVSRFEDEELLNIVKRISLVETKVLLMLTEKERR
jgi:hypothetical protein